MIGEWYLEQDGKEYGPYTSEQLKTLADNGAVSPQSILRGAGKRERAGSVPWLFEKVIAPLTDAEAAALSVAHAERESRHGSARSLGQGDASHRGMRVSYADPDENPAPAKVLYMARIHPAISLPVIALLLGLLILYGLNIKASWPNVTMFTMVVLGVAAAIFAVRAILRTLATECTVTDRGFAGKGGILNRQAVELPNYKIDDVEVKQGPLGRIFNYGSVCVVGTDGTRACFPGIADPEQFRARLLAK